MTKLAEVDFMDFSLNIIYIYMTFKVYFVHVHKDRAESGRIFPIVSADMCQPECSQVSL